MALIGEDFTRCIICGNAEFEKKDIVTLQKSLKREDYSVPYPELTSEIRYFCTACKSEKE